MGTCREVSPRSDPTDIFWVLLIHQTEKAHQSHSSSPATNKVTNNRVLCAADHSHEAALLTGLGVTLTDARNAVALASWSSVKAPTSVFADQIQLEEVGDFSHNFSHAD